jgi:hypothetical protein
MENKTTSNSSRRKVNGYNSTGLWAKRNRKRQEAEARQAEYDKLTTAQKLTQLGKTGSNRQRGRLEALLVKEKEAKKAAKKKVSPAA